MKKIVVFLAALLLFAIVVAISKVNQARAARAQAQASDGPMHDTENMHHDSMEGMDHASSAMSSHHINIGPHMHMTELRKAEAGDRDRANDIVEHARKTLEQYQDYRNAEADSFKIFLPNLPQKMYHFTNNWYEFEAAFRFNPDHPTSLLYEKRGDDYKLIGAMYTAPASFTEDKLNERIPLSVAQWHMHTNFCKAPKGREAEYLGRNAKFGLLGSITTKEECEAAGGTFMPHVFGWMVHVYPYEKDVAEIWSVERQEAHHH